MKISNKIKNSNKKYNQIKKSNNKIKNKKSNIQINFKMLLNNKIKDYK